MKNIIKKGLLFIVVFILIFRPEFTFIPFGINRFFGLLGLLVFYYDKKTRMVICNSANISFRPFFILLLPSLLWSFISLVLNQTSDLYFPKYVISMFLAFFGAYMMAWGFVKVYGNVQCKRLAEYLIVGCVLYTIIALLCFINPDLFVLLNSIQRIDEIAEMSMSNTEGTRLIGIGANFFTSAIVNGTILILLGVSAAVYRYSTAKKFMLLVAFAIISVLGLMMARTSMFGMLIGGCFLLLSFANSLKNFFQTIFASILFICAAFMIIPALVSDFAYEAEILISFGFEMFINKSQGGDMESHSMLRLYEMWATVPHNMETWIFGDGLWSGKNGYYMNVDLGYLRHIWYFGLIGTIFLFRYYYLTLKLIFWRKKLFAPKHKFLTLGLFAFTLILNTKGPCDLFIYIIPFYFCSDALSKSILAKHIKE